MKRQVRSVKFRTQQGLEVRVRPLAPDDVENLIDLFEHLSPISRYMRFNESLESPDPDYVRREAANLCQVDAKRGAAWIAFADLPDQPNAPVAGVRFVRTEDPTTAEVSVAVRDDLHQQGIGGALLLFVAQQAQAAGVARIVASFQTSNRAIWALLARAPYHVHTVVHGAQTEVIVELIGNHEHQLDNVVLADAKIHSP